MEDKSYVGMARCYFCGEPSTILLDRRLKDSLPHDAGVIDMQPCSKCAEYMKHGIILMSISDDTTEEQMKGPIPNPYRTGGWCVVKDEAVKRIFEESSKILAFTLEHRFAFITDSAWNLLSLPREEKGGNDEKR